MSKENLSIKGKSMALRLKNAGVKIVYPDKSFNIVTDVSLEYKGKKIRRPSVSDCPAQVKKHFGINI